MPFARAEIKRKKSRKEITSCPTGIECGIRVLKEQNLHIGSGAIESAIRRVVNLRLKGASIYWLEATAEAMLLLRAYYKAGRWNTLKELVFFFYCYELCLTYFF